MIRVSYEKLRLLMVKRRLEFKDIRVIFGFAPRTISKLRNDVIVDMDTAIRLCEYFECNLSDIMDVIYTTDEDIRI